MTIPNAVRVAASAVIWAASRAPSGSGGRRLCTRAPEGPASVPALSRIAVVFSRTASIQRTLSVARAARAASAATIQNRTTTFVSAQPWNSK